jgi:hypothetical protein
MIRVDELTTVIEREPEEMGVVGPRGLGLLHSNP